MKKKGHKNLECCKKSRNEESLQTVGAGGITGRRNPSRVFEEDKQTLELNTGETLGVLQEEHRHSPVCWFGLQAWSRERQQKKSWLCVVGTQNYNDIERWIKWYLDNYRWMTVSIEIRMGRG
ncbi:hypothetical protein ElyMa_001771700 [Elysia marginata]|uniref:Uncharacterized protein n=1 Tax=Elysia marginata TaxID=1093978 RepID=A0AAV4ECU0_9GAST|nr:hypothetical protein ElyMa_001771700 [Elysia marginata]